MLVLTLLGLASLLLPAADPPTVGCYWKGSSAHIPSFQCHGFAGSQILDWLMNAVLFVIFYAPLLALASLTGSFGNTNLFSDWSSLLGVAVIAVIFVALLTPIRWSGTRLWRLRSTS